MQRYRVRVSAQFECDELKVSLNEDRVDDLDTYDRRPGVSEVEVTSAPIEPSVQVVIFSCLCDVDAIDDLVNDLEDDFKELEDVAIERGDDNTVLTKIFVDAGTALITYIQFD